MFLDSFVVLCCAGEELPNCFHVYFEIKIVNGCFCFVLFFLTPYLCCWFTVNGKEMFYQDVLHLWHDIWNVLWKFKPGLHCGRHRNRSRNHGSVRALFKWLSKDQYKRNHLTNHNGSSQRDEPIRIPCNFPVLAQSAGKIARTRCNGFCCCFSLVEKLTRDF